MAKTNIARSRTSSRRRALSQRGGGGTRPSPKGAGIVIFHVRDLAPVKEMTDRLHSEWGSSKRRGKGGRTRSQKGTWTRASGHPPVFLTDKHHLVALAPSLGPANSMRRLLERALGNAI